MPDVKWYSASTASTGVAVASGSGTTNRLMKFDASKAAADSSILDDGTNVTPDASDGAALGSATMMWSDLFLASGAVINYDNSNVTWTHAAGLLRMASGSNTLEFNQVAAGTYTFIGLSGLTTGTYRIGISSGNGLALNAPTNETIQLRINNSDIATVSSTGISGANGKLLSVTGASFNIGNAATAPASNYLVIGGVSGAGGHPVETNVTAGSGVVIYTQETHDGAATKLVFAYNLGGSMRYITIPLDGTTTTLTHNATRP